MCSPLQEKPTSVVPAATPGSAEGNGSATAPGVSNASSLQQPTQVRGFVDTETEDRSKDESKGIVRDSLGAVVIGGSENKAALLST